MLASDQVCLNIHDIYYIQYILNIMPNVFINNIYIFSIVGPQPITLLNLGKIVSLMCGFHVGVPCYVPVPCDNDKRRSWVPHWSCIPLVPYSLEELPVFCDGSTFRRMQTRCVTDYSSSQTSLVSPRIQIQLPYFQQASWRGCSGFSCVVVDVHKEGQLLSLPLMLAVCFW